MAAGPYAESLPVIDGFDAEGARPVSWDEVTGRFGAGGWCWLATVDPTGAPQTRPLFAVWSDPVFFIASKETARKSRNLDRAARCCLTTETDDLHLVVEAVAEHVTEAGALSRASAAFAAIYEWPTTVSGGKLDAPYGAPTSGGPPYDVYALAPYRAFAFPTGKRAFPPTRWRFDS